MNYYKVLGLFSKFSIEKLFAHYEYLFKNKSPNNNCLVKRKYFNKFKLIINKLLDTCLGLSTLTTFKTVIKPQFNIITF